MRSASTSRVADPNELSRVAQEKATRGQPTLARVAARPVEEPRLSEVRRGPELPRVVARPVMGQAPAQPPGTVPLDMDGVQKILAGLNETLRLADGARTTGWRCTGVDDATFYRGRVLRDRLAAYVANPSGIFMISRDEVDVADKILGCSDEATASSPNKNAYLVLGVIVVGAAVFFSLTR
jgi:hypothetical protein